MPDPNIESLLILQDRDAQRLEIENQLAAIPREIRMAEAKIVAEKEKLEASKGRIRELEVKRKDLDTQVAAAEEQIVRYRNQQLQVKKNEEYQALTHEIETTEGKIGQLEEQEIQILFDLDEEKQRVAAIEKDFGKIIGQLEEKIESHKAREGNLRRDLEAKRAEVEKARGAVADPKYLAVYDRQARVVKFPIVAPVIDRACQGCHLRVSGGVDAEAREMGKITTCDSCGRIVYSPR